MSRKPFVAPRDAAERVGQEVEHLREGQRQHHEVDALAADRDPAHHRRHESAYAQRNRKHHGGRQPGPDKAEAGHVAADPEEDALAEGEEAGIAEQQVAGSDRQPKDQDLAGEGA
ncbi:hypothetical protein M2440_000173 [Methylorubrum extorquens]|nr:hypothetical protein [Methylorubrum extorquens]